MAAINTGRLWLGTVAGGVAFLIWTMIVNIGFQADNYQAGQDAGMLRFEPRYGSTVFSISWVITLFLLTFIGAWLYANVRATAGPGPGTALKVGAFVGFAAGFPMNLSLVNWLELERITALWWMLDLWIGAIVAIFIAAWLYRE